MSHERPAQEQFEELSTTQVPVRRQGRRQAIVRRHSPETDAIEEAELGRAPGDRPTSPFFSRRDRLLTMSAVSAGGLLGANARYVVGHWITDRWRSDFPWATLLINVSGCFVLGFYLTLMTERLPGRSTTRLFIATGFLGAYTTFSTFSYEGARLLQAGDAWRALAYLMASIVIGLAATAAGMILARWLSSWLCLIDS